MTKFQKKVYEFVATIPKGEVMTYKQVAESIGSPKAYRAVGNALNKNYDENIPCHRVVRSDGSVGGYNKGQQRKKQKIKEEKLLVNKNL